MQISKILASVLFTTVMTSQAVFASTGSKAKALSQTFESYSVTNDATIRVLQVESGKASIGQEIKLAKGSDITVLATDKDPKYGKILRIGVDSDESQASDIWIRATDLIDAGLQRSDFDTSTVDPLVAEENQDDISFGNGLMFDLDQVSETRHMTYCYRFVKQYLLQNGLVPVYLPGGSAWMASRYLPKYGWLRSGRNQYNAKIGDVCVYSGGNGGNGHIEIKRPAGWWYGYGYHGPISLKNHKLIACFKK